MEEDINYYSQKEQQEAKKHFGEMIGAYMVQEQDEDNPRLVIRKNDIEKLKALLFMTENLLKQNKELEEENKYYKKYAIIMTTDGLLINGVKFSFNDYIPASVIEEKKTKLKEQYNKVVNNVNDNGIIDQLIDFQKVSAKIQVIDEILEEGRN